MSKEKGESGTNNVYIIRPTNMPKFEMIDGVV